MTNILLPFFYIFLYIKFLFHAREGHRTDESIVYFLWRKGSIVFAKAPSNACVAIWTAAIDGIGIIEIDADSVGFFPVSEPQQKLFTPIHTDIAMNFPSLYELVLCSIPERIFCSAVPQVIE